MRIPVSHINQLSDIKKSESKTSPPYTTNNLKSTSFIMSPFADANELTIDAEWDNMCDVITTEELPSSSKEVCKVLEEWTSDEESVDMDIMEVDEQIGTNFLCDDLFGGCPSPVSPQEELLCMNVDDMHCDKFLTLPSDDKTSVQQREAFLKLAESMKRSQETRLALSMKSSKATDEYARRKSISAVLASIEQSGNQIHTCFAASC